MTQKINMSDVLSQTPPQPNDVAIVLRCDGGIDVISYLENDIMEKEESIAAIGNMYTAIALHKMLQDPEFVLDIQKVISDHEIHETMIN